MSAVPDPRYTAVDGPPGAGVSAIARALAGATESTLVADPAPQNPFLDDFAKNPKRFAFQAQVYCLLARYRQQVELAQPNLFSPRGIVTDYLFARDALFAKIILGSEELGLYDKIHRLLTARLPRPDRVVYLTADREVLRARIRSCVAASDRIIKLNVMEQLANELDQYIFSYVQTPLLVINTSEYKILEDPHHIKEIVDVVQQAPPGVTHYRPTNG